ncbi:MAG: 4-hydroxybenzoate octaprenyltransferase [Robiginitomaculum sp.]|nr:4-hydroxybenzoate octaprenyltransferase [Robiginitomaculum sp.]
MVADKTIKDSVTGGWVERMPERLRPYLRLSRYDRPIGFWLLALPGWIGLAFAALGYGFAWGDLKWAVLIGIGAVAMRGAGCTYNDIIDRDLDKQVERTTLRPLPAGTVTLKQAWIWLVLQCLAGLVVLAFFPRQAQIIAVSSLALVAVYPFMKRITYWPQAWLGLTFNWAVLVAYVAKTGMVDLSIFLLYAGLVFWTIGYDTIYACQDTEDDALIGVKSTARLFGGKVKLGVGAVYLICIFLIGFALIYAILLSKNDLASVFFHVDTSLAGYIIVLIPFAVHLLWQVFKLDPNNGELSLRIFKSNRMAALLLILTLSLPRLANML